MDPSERVAVVGENGPGMPDPPGSPERPLGAPPETVTVIKEGEMEVMEPPAPPGPPDGRETVMVLVGSGLVPPYPSGNPGPAVLPEPLGELCPGSVTVLEIGFGLPEPPGLPGLPGEPPPA